MNILLRNQCFLIFILLMILKITVQIEVNGDPAVMIIPRDGTVDLCKNKLEKISIFNLTLQKGNNGDIVCVAYTTDNRSGIGFHKSEEKPQCRFINSSGSFFFTLTNLDVMDTDNYTCDMKVVVPAPFTSVKTRTIVYVYDCHKDMMYWMWILSAVASLLFICFILMIYIAIQRKHCRKCITRTKELSKECNSEYMHMAAVPLVRPPVC